MGKILLKMFDLIEKRVKRKCQTYVTFFPKIVNLLQFDSLRIPIFIVWHNAQSKYILQLKIYEFNDLFCIK